MGCGKSGWGRMETKFNPQISGAADGPEISLPATSRVLLSVQSLRPPYRLTRTNIGFPDTQLTSPTPILGPLFREFGCVGMSK